MSGQIPFCFPNTSLAQAAKMMAENRIPELPVIVDERVLGYLSYRDVLNRYVQGRVEGRASDIIRTPLPAVRPETQLADVVRLLRESGRHLVMVTTPEGMPLGAVTVRDIARLMAA